MTVLNRIGARLRPTERVPVEPQYDADQPPRATGQEIEFAAYAEDCRLVGFYRLSADRLTDALNDSDTYDLADVMLERLDTGISSHVTGLTVARDELLAVRATGPRGDAARRSRRRPSPITLQSGPYTIHGYVHAMPGGDPISEVRRRRAMVPLTECWIEYRAAGSEHRARAGTMIVNRDLIDWVRLSKDEEVGLPDLPVERKPGPLVKDLTGYIHTEPVSE